MDVQRRQLAAGHGTFSREASRGQARINLDDSGFSGLVCLRGAALGSVSQLDTGPRRRDYRGHDRVAQVSHGPNGVALGVGLVPHGPTALQFRHAGRAERESRARNPARMGKRVRLLLDLLDYFNSRYGGFLVVVRTVALENLARRAFT